MSNAILTKLGQNFSASISNNAMVRSPKLYSQAKHAPTQTAKTAPAAP